MLRRVQGSQIFKQNWNILICSRVIVILPIWVSLAVEVGAGRWGGGCPGWSAIVYMSSGMLRGKESSNRIKLSQLVQDLLNFGVLGSLQFWGGGRWVVGVWGDGGCPHTCAHACTHMHTCTHTCKKLQMATNMFIMIVVCSLSLPCHPPCPHVIPTSSLSSPHHPQTPV